MKKNLRNRCERNPASGTTLLNQMKTVANSRKDSHKSSRGLTQILESFLKLLT